jgi:signal transduction histidine kinase
MNRRLLAMVREAGKTADPSDAMERLLNACVEQTSASAGRIYLLNLASSSYLRICQVGGGDAPECIPVSLLEPDAKPKSLVELAIVQRRLEMKDRIPLPPRGLSDVAEFGSRLVMPIVRESSCLGVIELASDRSGHFVAFHEEIAEFTAEVALILSDKQYTLRLLKALPEPIKLNQPFETFLDDLVILIAEASGMPFIALRELIDPESLQCLTSYGFQEDMASLTITPLSEYESFKRAVELREPIKERTIWAPHLAVLREKSQLARVRSFVLVPVMVGEELLGTLSLSAECEYDYSELEVSGFQTIANAIGVSISNYRAVHAAADNMYKAAQVDSAITSLEIAQAARHEIIDRTAEAQEAVLLIRNTVAGTPSREDLQRVRKKAEEITDALNKINQVINNIKTVTKPPAREWQRVNIRKLWMETFALFHGRLANLGIKTTVTGDAEAEVIPDYLRHAFLHLLLNSVDAFKDRRQKSNRLITVSIDPQSDQAVNLTIRYTDNATGIDASKLLNLPSSDPGRTSVPADIFLPGVTSKAAQGSGFGLYLANRILKEHKGSLTLVDHRNGVVFDITLPKFRPQRGKKIGGDAEG